MRKNSRVLLWFVSVCLLIFIDQRSKFFAIHYQSVVWNRGVAFGLGTLPPMLNWLMIAIFSWWLIKQRLVIKPNQVKIAACWQLSKILVIAGAIGNAIDRQIYGAVVDWLPMPGLSLKNNLADYYVVLGLLSLGIIWYQQERKIKHPVN